MGFFTKFPVEHYTGQDAQSLITAVVMSHINVDKSFVYQRYLVSDQQTPESLADQLYRDASLYWTILVVNDIVDPFNDWPLSDRELEEYVSMVYEEPDGIHHFYDNRTDREVDDVDDAAYRLVPAGSLPFYIIPVTNKKYESDENMKRRQITVINPRYITQFVETYNKALEGKL